MANPICTATTLITNAACYKTTSLSPRDLRALAILAKVYELKGIGGTDYSSALVTTLVSDAATMTCGMEKSDIDAAHIAIAFGNATNAGGVPPATVALKVAAIKCLIQLEESALNEIDLMLDCKLGIHKSYVQ